MQEINSSLTSAILKQEAYKLSPGDLTGYDPLLDFIGDARFVLIGEASHGTHEFYRERAQITKRLIAEKGFSAVAVEADFPDAYRLNRYVRGEKGDAEAVEAMGGFKRFPAWMWRNADVLDFIGWLRTHNDDLSEEKEKVGFYGLDLYSLHASIEAVIAYLDEVDPEGAKRARLRYSCFDYFGADVRDYGYATSQGIADSCEEEVISQLVELNRGAGELVRRDGIAAADDFFFAEQNARLVKNAEQYYRTMYHSDVSSWNLRDSHMTETLAALEKHLSTTNEKTKIVVWAHNSHLGRASATDMGQRGEINVGQLVKEHYGREAISIGFTTYRGTVTAATDWGGPAERKMVRNALPGSYEYLFHQTGLDRFLILMSDGSNAEVVLEQPMLERAIGVIYRPQTERQSHYFHASLSNQFDVVIHIDATRAVEPIERTSEWDEGEEFETFPSGI